MFIAEVFQLLVALKAWISIRAIIISRATEEIFRKARFYRSGPNYKTDRRFLESIGIQM